MTSDVQTPLPTTLKEKLASLELSLKNQNPAYESALAFIHAETHRHPEYVYMLSDEEICTIVQGYEMYTKLSIDVGKISKKQGNLLDANNV